MTLWYYGIDEHRGISPHPRPGRAPIRPAAAITAVCVAIGALVSTSTMVRFEAPADVAQRYVAALFREDWQTTWELLCAPSRALSGTYSDFAEKFAGDSAELRMPSDVDVDAGHVSIGRGTTGPLWTVAITVTSNEGDFGSQTRKLPVAFEDGTLRVCPLAVEDT